MGSTQTIPTHWLNPCPFITHWELTHTHKAYHSYPCKIILPHLRLCIQFIYLNLCNKPLSRLWEWLNGNRCVRCKQPCVAHTHTLERLCTHHVCRVCFHTQGRFSSSSLLHRGKSAVAARESNWSESIQHMSRRSCLAAPAEAWAEILPADRLFNQLPPRD